MKKKIIRRVILSSMILVSFTAVATSNWSSEARVSGQQGTGWKVWVKTSPCAGGRTDWVSVAQRNPTEGGGGSFWVLADQLVTPVNCTTASDNSCTFAQANAVAAVVRASNRFRDYCCRDYSVWENTQTRELSVVKGPGSAGFGWQQVDSNLCCEEAEARAGKTGLCSGAKTGYIGCYKDTSDFDLNGYLERSQNNTPQRCIETCRARGFAYAGVQYGQSCLCGNSYGKYGVATNCDYRCTGDPGQFCGGYSTNSVYATGISLGGIGGRGGNRGKGAGDNTGSNVNGDDGDGQTTTTRGRRPCNANEAAAFARMLGSWKSSGPKITISGSCENATGVYLVAEYCESPDATYNQSLPRYRGTFTGRMEGQSLQVEWALPGGSVHKDTKGTASCRLESDGTLSCSGFGCGVGNARKQ